MYSDLGDRAVKKRKNINRWESDTYSESGYAPVTGRGIQIMRNQVLIIILINTLWFRCFMFFST